MKKTLIILLSTVITASTFVGCGSNGGTTAKEPQKQEQEQKQQQENKIEKIKLNQVKKFTGVELAVLNSKETESVSNDSGETDASGKFIIIELSMKNISKEPIEYTPQDFRLLNNDTEYEEDDNSFKALQNLSAQKTIFDKDKDYIGPYNKFNPGITKKIYIVFDVPKDLSLNDTSLIVGGNKDIEFSLTE